MLTALRRRLTLLMTALTQTKNPQVSYPLPFWQIAQKAVLPAEFDFLI